MIKAIVPIKLESERLPNKNFLMFCGQPLYEVILDTLEQVREIDAIIVNTDSDRIQKEIKSRYQKVVVIDRPSFLLGNEITMNKIIAYDLLQTEGEHFIQTHCTNPLLTERTIKQAIDLYFNNLELYDSLLSVDKVQKRAYRKSGEPINHQNDRLLPTQLLEEVLIENSNLFLFSRTSFFNANKSRVGLSPQLFPISAIESVDIDYKQDFLLAELIQKHRALLTTDDE